MAKQGKKKLWKRRKGVKNGANKMWKTVQICKIKYWKTVRKKLWKTMKTIENCEKWSLTGEKGKNNQWLRLHNTQ